MVRQCPDRYLCGRVPASVRNCPACAHGEGHASYALYGRLNGKRFSIYVPNDLVPEISAAIANGHRVQELLSEAGVGFTQALKERRKRKEK